MKRQGKVATLLLFGSFLLDYVVYVSAADDETGKDEISAILEDETRDLESFRATQLRFALDSAAKADSSVYPNDVDPYFALVNYDEIPTPIPFGPSVWFIIITTLAISWYMTEIVRYLIKTFGPKLELYPKTEAFPRLYVHWLQQSKRECNLRREARNTWCYTAKTLLMSPEDPLMNIDEACRTSWADFQHHRNIWQIVRAVVIANGMLKSVRERNRYIEKTYAADLRAKANAIPLSETASASRIKSETNTLQVLPTPSNAEQSKIKRIIAKMKR